MPDLALARHARQNRIMSIEVKICGVASRAALDSVITAGADYFGLVIYPPSPRSVGVDTAARLAAEARGRGGIRSVTLLVDPDDALLDLVVSQVQPDVIQLHGEESVDRVAAIRARTGTPLIKAVAVRMREDVEAAAAYRDPGRLADLILFDAKAPPGSAIPGGNGLSFDWRMLDGLDRGNRFALAGGLTPTNVAAAIRVASPAIVDVSSGVETAPGVKDPALVRAFVAAARAATGHEALNAGGAGGRR